MRRLILPRHPILKNLLPFSPSPSRGEGGVRVPFALPKPKRKRSPMGSNPTIKDVAKKAGVSITTVSFVLNNRTDVVISEAVKKRVLSVADRKSGVQGQRGAL